MTFRTFLVVVVVLSGAAIRTAGAEPYRHPASGFECPDDLAGFTRTGVDDYETRDPRLGVACKYQFQKDLYADVYIYTAGLSPVPSEPTHPLMLQLHDQTLKEIAQYAESRGEQPRRLNEATLKVESSSPRSASDCSRAFARSSSKSSIRDALRASPELAARYFLLKTELASKYKADGEAYTVAKNEFVRSVVG